MDGVIGSAKVSGNKITLPKSVRSYLGVKNGDYITFYPDIPPHDYYSNIPKYYLVIVKSTKTGDKL